jgi:transposase InsO family protein
LICIDTFYIGKLKGVGKLWQITACDAASSYAMARVVPVCNAQQAASFLKQVVAVELAEAGWRLQRVLTDGGSEFRGEFDVACRELDVRHTRTRPRHAWTNGFVERLQGTILHEHWRVAFRRRYFRRRVQLQTSLDGFLKHYNFERVHQGYRTKGRTPAEIFWGAVREQRHEEV